MPRKEHENNWTYWVQTQPNYRFQAGATSCMGDSGGPLTYMENGKKVLLGNVSWGHSQCVENGYPSAYSRNQEPSVNAWIKQNAGLQ